MKLNFLLFTIFVYAFSFSQDKQSYQLFDKIGNKTTYANLILDSQKSDIVLFGEQHDNSVAHWLELELTKDLWEIKPIILGAEMLEADNQKALDQYLKSEIDQEQLDSIARLWPNYQTDYKPIVDFAKDHSIPFIATNVPRRYASLVYKQGFESLNKLSESEKAWMPELPIFYDASMPVYVRMVSESGGHAGENFPKAQAIKDATMAYFILKNQQLKTLFIHFNGSYHSDNFDGIYAYLKKGKPNLKILTLSTVTQKDISKLETEHVNKADFIIVIDEDVTRTY